MAILRPDTSTTLNGVKINEYLLTKHNLNHIDMPSVSMEGKVIGVTVHNTDWISVASGTTPAEQYTRATVNGNMKDVRVHYYVDNVYAWQNLPLTLSGWHAADGSGNGNRRTIAIECIMSSAYNATNKLSRNNANEELAIRFGRTGKEVQALEELGQVLGLAQPPQYIEAYDISNLSATSMVCGMVVFENGRPLKRAYKRFRMKENVSQQDDYACMREAITRRLTHYLNQDEEGFSRLPDLILLDGGQGHVNTITPIVQQMGLHIPIYGMVKDQKHRTRAISSTGGEISLSANRSAFHLLTRIQDEVHRFSVAYMHSVHKKSSYQLELTKVRGIGEKKAQKLLLQYKTIAKMKQASPEELAKAAGVGSETAHMLWQTLQEMQTPDAQE